MSRKALLGLVVATTVALGALVVAGPGGPAAAGPNDPPTGKETQTQSPSPTPSPSVPQPFDANYAVILRSGGMGDEYEYLIRLAADLIVPLKEQDIFWRLDVGDWLVRLETDVTDCSVVATRPDGPIVWTVLDPVKGEVSVKTFKQGGEMVESGYEFTVDC